MARDGATTFEPHTDTTYVPCISLRDFWRAPGALDLVVYAHSLDFHAKSAHVYEPELALTAELSA